MANGYIGDHRIRELEKLMRKMCQSKGYDLDTAFKGLLDYLLWMFDPGGRKPDGWRFDHEDAMMFYQMAQAYFTVIAEELKNSEWYDAFGDLYMALHPGGGGKAQFFTPPHVCTVTAECCMAGMKIDDQPKTTTPFGKRHCINDPAAGSSRLLMAGASIYKRLQRNEGMDDIQQATHRPYLIAEDLDYNCVKMSAINMAVHGHFGECVCHDSLCEPDQVRLGYIVNEMMWPFPTNIPSIRRYDDPLRFVTTRQWKLRRKQSQGSVEADSNKVAPASTLPDPVQTEKPKQPQQLTLW
jgi:type I restriction enzyme M protein